MSTLRRRFACVGAACLGVALVSAVAAHGRPFVVVLPGPIVREGSYEECVYQSVLGGMRLKDAMKKCAELKSPDMTGRWIDPFDVFGEGATGTSSFNCGSQWVNPMAPTEHSPGWNEAYQLAMRVAAIKAVRSAVVNDWQGTQDKDQRKEWAELIQKLSNEAWDAIQQEGKVSAKFTQQEKEELARLMHDAGPSDGRDKAPAKPPVGDFPERDPNAPTPARPVTDGESVCAHMAEFIGQCNRRGWRSPECKVFLDRMKGCDSRVARTVGDDEKCNALPPIDPESVQQAILTLCLSRAHPVPGEDPCQLHIEGDAFRYRLGHFPGGIDPCNDPHARTTDDACLGTFTLVRFREINADSLQKKGFDLFGGPVFIIPVKDPQPPPGGPGPDPRPNPK